MAPGLTCVTTPVTTHKNVLPPHSKFQPGRDVAESGWRRRMTPLSSAMASARQESPLGGGKSDPRGLGACAGLPPVGAPVRWRMPDHCLCQHDSPGDPSCLQQRLFCLVQRFRRRGRSPTGANGELPAHLAHPNLVSWGLWRRPAVLLAGAIESSALAAAGIYAATARDLSALLTASLSGGV